MHDYTVITPDIRIREQYEALPEHVRSELSAHFEAVHCAKSLRKLPYPAHRNRGVTVRYEDEELKVSLHIARDQDRNIQILGLLSTIRDVVGMQDYKAVHSVKCPECHQAPGSACRMPGGEATDRPHLRRRMAMESVEADHTVPDGKAPTWSLTAGEILAALKGEMEAPDAWRQSFDSYRVLKGRDGDLMLRGAAAFVAARNPRRMWSPLSFRLFVEESVTGPFLGPMQVAASWVRRDRGLRRLTEREAHAYLTKDGPLIYARQIGATFFPLEDARIMAIENPKVVDAG